MAAITNISVRKKLRKQAEIEYGEKTGYYTCRDGVYEFVFSDGICRYSCRLRYETESELTYNVFPFCRESIYTGDVPL